MLKRALSAIALSIPLLVLLLAGSRGLLFPVLLIAAFLLIREWVRLKEPITLGHFLPLVGSAWLLQWTYYLGYGDWLALEMVLILMGGVGWSLVDYAPGKVVSAQVSFRYMGVIYCALPLVFLDEIRSLERGGAMICLLLFVIWATDTGAYLVGRRYGERRLVPLISPNKTWAGFWGGTTLGTLAGVGSVTGFVLPFSLWEGVVLSLLLSWSGQVGDLVVSVLKRESGVKDTGHLIPGHGGLLDRLDSLLFAAPAFAMYLHLRGS